MLDETAVRIAARRLRRGDALGALKILSRQATTTTPAAPGIYACCRHCDCPVADGHVAPCTKCEQRHIRTADEDVARAMAATP